MKNYMEHPVSSEVCALVTTPILVVEDDEGLNALIQKALRRAGFDARGVLTGAAALEAVMGDPRDRNRERVLLVDQRLPDMDGTDLIRTLGDRGRRMPFVAMTGQGDEKVAVEMMKLGARDYLVKGFDLVHLLPEVFNRVFRELETERRLAAAEAALRESEERHRLLFENASQGIGYYDLDGNIIAFNAVAAALMGGRPEAFAGRSLVDLYGPEAGAEYLRRLRAAAASPENQVYEDHVPLPTGEFWFLSTYTRITDTAGKVVGVQVVSADITDRKRAEEALRESEARYRTILEASPILFIIHQQGVIRYINNAGCAILGCERPEELLGRSVFEFVHPVFFDLAKSRLERLEADRANPPADIGLLRNDGETIHVQSISLPFDYQGETAALLMATDVTSRKSAEERLRATLEQQEAVFDTSMVGIALLHDRIVTKVNRRMAEILGYAPEELIGRSPEHIHLSHEHYEAFGEKYYWRLAEKTVLQVEYPLRHKDGRTVWCLFNGRAIAPPDLSLGAVWVIDDITERKKTEEALEKRLLALTMPLEIDAASLDLEELFNLADIQRLQDEFAEAVGVASLITRTDGTPITRPSNFTRLCEVIIRGTDAGRRNCFRSAEMIGRKSEREANIRTCLSGGLWDAGAAIRVGGKHIANWMIGQVRDETHSEASMREYARKIGADPDAAAEAFHEVPTMSRERFERIAAALYTLANQLSNSAYQNVQQARFITERKRAEAALRESEEKYRRIFENSVVGIFQSTPEGRFISVNPAFARMFGYTSPEEMVETITDIATQYYANPPDRRRYREMLRVHRYVENFEFEARRKDGSRIWVSNSTRAYADDGGTMTRYEGIVIDITDRKAAEASLRESEERYRTIFFNSPLGIFRSTFEGRFIEVNPALARMLGYDSPEAVLREIYDIGEQIYIRSEERKEIVARQEAQEGVTRHLNHYRRGDGGEFIANLYLKTVFDDAGNPLFLEGIVEDITESRHAEAEREKLERQFHQAQKLESVGRLAGGVAHDLNNLLSPILGYGEMLLEDSSENDPRRNSLEQIVSAGLRARDLVRQLLAFSRKQTLAFRPVDLNDLLRNFEKLLRRTIREDVAIRILPGEGLPLVKGDIGQLEQVVMNLAVNAQDAMPDGGILTIRTGVVELDETYTSDHEGVNPGPYVMLSVSDTGFGMDDEVREHLFEPFFTTKGTDQGTGLGLATVYGIVKQHGGNIWVYSETGMGATFKVYLPVSEESAAAEEKVAEKSVAAPGSETILLAEDNDQVRNLVLAILKREGYTVLMAESGNEALALLDRHQGHLDLLLTDVVMPEMNGRQLYEAVAARFPEVKTLYMSGYTDNVIAHRGVTDEGVDFIQKPFSVRVLAAKVREVLDKS